VTHIPVIKFSVQVESNIPRKHNLRQTGYEDTSRGHV